MFTLLQHLLTHHNQIPVQWHPWPPGIVRHDLVPYLFRARLPLFPPPLPR